MLHFSFVYNFSPVTDPDSAFLLQARLSLLQAGSIFFFTMSSSVVSHFTHPSYLFTDNNVQENVLMFCIPGNGTEIY